jgi:hypothetical protein
MPTEKVPTKLEVQILNIENYNTHEAKVDFFVELGEFVASSVGSFTVALTWAIGEKQDQQVTYKETTQGWDISSNDFTRKFSCTHPGGGSDALLKLVMVPDNPISCFGFKEIP